MTFEIYEDDAGEYRWRLTSGGDIVADSGEGYSDRDGAEEAVERIQRDAPTASVLDHGVPHFEVYEDRGGEWRWRLVSTNGRIIADSGEGYDSRSGARRAIRSVQREADE